MTRKIGSLVLFLGFGGCGAGVPQDTPATGWVEGACAALPEQDVPVLRTWLVAYREEGLSLSDGLFGVIAFCEGYTSYLPYREECYRCGSALAEEVWEH